MQKNEFLKLPFTITSQVTINKKESSSTKSINDETKLNFSINQCGFLTR